MVYLQHDHFFFRQKEQIGTFSATRRLVINPPAIPAGSGDVENDPILRDGDRLLIPRMLQGISVIGEVRIPTSHMFHRSMSVADYTNRSGGTTQDAGRRSIFIFKASGEVVPYAASRWFLQERSRLNADDAITVPFITYRTNYLKAWISMSLILFNISTTLLAIERVGN